MITRWLADLFRIGDASICNLELELAKQPTVNDMGSLTPSENTGIFRGDLDL